MKAVTATLDERATRHVVFVLMTALFASALAYSAVLPILPLILERAGLAPGAVTWHTGMLTGAYMLAVFLFAPLWGRLSDRIGRRPLLVAGLCGIAAALVGFALFRTLELAYIARALTGVFVAAIIPAGTAEVGDISQPASRAPRFALLTSASLLGFFVGPTLGGLLVNVSWFDQKSGNGFGPYLPAGIAAAISAISALAVLVWVPRGTPSKRYTERETASEHVTFGQRGAPALLVLLVMFALTAFEVAITLRGQQRLGWTPGQIALLFAECSVVMIVIQGFFFAALVRTVSRAWLLGPGIGAMILGLILMPFTAKYEQLLLLVILISAGASIVAPMITYWASIGAGMAQGAALGTQTAASSLGQALGSATVGALFGFSASAPFWLAAALLAIGGVLFVASATHKLVLGKLALHER